jgi:apolipoprotein N-acyltransferase
MSLARFRTPAAGVVSGLLFALAFPPLEWVALAPLALVPWLVALAGEEKRGRALLSGFLFGLAYWCASIPWIVYVVTNFGGQSGVMGIACLAIAAAILAQWPAFVAWGVVAAAPAGSLWRLALFPLLWTASEHARARVYGGFPWNLTGFALYRHPVWIQTASLGGVYAVGFLVVSASALLAAGIAYRRRAWFAVAAILVLAAGLFGLARLSRPAPSGPTVRAALVQPGIPQEARLDPNATAPNYAAVIEQAREAAREPAGLIVIPESAFPTYWDASPTLRRDLTGIAAACRCPVLFNDIETEPGGRYYNVARLVTPEGLAGRSYRKVHLVPFGEHVPLPKLFFFVRQISTEIGEFSSAPEPTLLTSGGLRVGMGVCYEITYDGLSRAETDLGANLLATISNDSWYGRAGAQPQHFAAGVLRAVENGRYLLRAAITGTSGAADDRGRILAELDPGRKGTLHVTARLLSEKTAWTRWGYLLPLAADAAALAVLLFAVARWWRQRSHD